MTLNDYVPLIFRRLRPQSRPREAASLIMGLAQTYGLENIGEIDEQFLDGFTCASEIVIAQLEKEFESDHKGEWIFYDEEFYQQGRFESVHHRIRECSICHHKIAEFVGDMNFCPNCGADMRGVRK